MTAFSADIDEQLPALLATVNDLHKKPFAGSNCILAVVAAAPMGHGNNVRRLMFCSRLSMDGGRASVHGLLVSHGFSFRMDELALASALLSGQEPLRTCIGHQVNTPVLIASAREPWRGEEPAFDGFIDFLIPKIEYRRTVRQAQPKVASITLEPDTDLEIRACEAWMPSVTFTHWEPRAVIQGTAD